MAKFNNTSLGQGVFTNASSVQIAASGNDILNQITSAPIKIPINKSWLYKSLYLYETSYITKKEYDSIQEMLNSEDLDAQALGSGLIDIKMRELRDDILAYKEIKKGQVED